jgi:ABC-2 type transport system permease protein
LGAAGDAADFDVEYTARRDADGVTQAVRAGDATVGLAGDSLYAAEEDAGNFPLVVTQVVVALETSRQLADAGLTPQQVDELRSIRPPDQVIVGTARDEGRAGVGAAVGMLLQLALLFGGSAIAATVALEKTTRISEVVLAVLRPSQAMVGTVLAVGTVTLAQLLVLGAPITVAVLVTDSIGLPSVAAGDMMLGLVWFLLGWALYAFLYAATGACVNKVTEVDTVAYPIAFTIFGGYFISLMLITDDPDGPWSILLSMFPFTAPLAMPIRWAYGDVPAWQILLAMALTAATAVALVTVASTVYRRALLITGRRVKVREVIAGTAAP